MSTRVQWRRGNSAQTATFTGASGEITVDTDKNVVVVHDNVTPGGYPAPQLSFVQDAYNIANSAYNAANSAGSNATVSNAYNVANGAFDKANSANVLAQSAYDSSNSVGTFSQSAYNYANTIGTFSQAGYNKANSAYDAATSASTVAFSAYDKANTAYTNAGSAYNYATDVDTKASAAFNKANSANVLAQSAYNSSNTKFSSSGGTITGNVDITGQANVSQRLSVGTGSYTVLPNLISQFTGNSDYYSQINQQNLSGNGSGDIVVTADNGTDEINFIDMGMAGSTYDDATPNAYPTTKPNDGYLYLVGNPAASFGGNLVIGTSGSSSFADISFVQGTGYDESARLVYGQGLVIETGTVSSSNASGALVVEGGVGVQGAVYADALYDNGVRITVGASNAFDKANGAFDKANAANVLAQSAYDSGNSTLTYATAGFDKANAANVLAQSAYDSGNSTNTLTVSSYNKANAANVLAQSAYDSGNNTMTYATAGFNKANAANVLAQSAYDSGNNTLTYSTSGFNKANAANVLAQSAYDSGNSTLTYATAGFDKANAANVLAQSSYDKGNTTLTYATAAFDKTNSSYNFANSVNTYAFSAYASSNTKATVYNTSSAPTSAQVDDIWIDPNSGIEYVNISSNSAVQWVEFGPLGTPQNVTANLQFADQTIFNTNGNKDIVIQSTGTGNIVLIAANTIVANLLPSTPTATLGTQSQPFANVWVSNASIHMAGNGTTSSQPVIISNDANNVVISTGGLKLTGGVLQANSVLGTSHLYSLNVESDFIVANSTFGSNKSLVNITGSQYGSQPPLNPGYILHVTGQDGQASRIVNDAFGTGNYPLIALRAARGTAGTPTAVQTGDLIARYSGNAFDGTSYASSGVARIDMYATENHTTSSKGSKIVFGTMITGSNVFYNVATFDGQAGVTFNSNVTSNIYVYSSNTANAGVTQSSSKSTSVTANGASGVITMNNAKLNHQTSVTFTVNNSFVLHTTDVPIVAIQNPVTSGLYQASVGAVRVGSFDVIVWNTGAGPGQDSSDAIVINFAIIRVGT